MSLAGVFGGAFLYEAAQAKLTEIFQLHPEFIPSIEYYLTVDWLAIGAFVLACGPITMYCVAFRPPLGECRTILLRVALEACRHATSITLYIQTQSPRLRQFSTIFSTSHRSSSTSRLLQ
jgi:hypothetical protein